MFEDAFVVGDPERRRPAVRGRRPARHGERDAQRRGDRSVRRGAVGARGRASSPNPRRVLQAHDTALVVSERSVSVLRRAGDGFWRYAISLLDVGDTTREEHR